MKYPRSLYVQQCWARLTTRPGPSITECAIPPATGGLHIRYTSDPTCRVHLDPSMDLLPSNLHFVDSRLLFSGTLQVLSSHVMTGLPIIQSPECQTFLKASFLRYVFSAFLCAAIDAICFNQRNLMLSLIIWPQYTALQYCGSTVYRTAYPIRAVSASETR